VGGSGETFQRALDAIQSRAQATTDGPASRAPTIGSGCGLGPVQGAGGEARWDLAMDWAKAPAALEASSLPVAPESVDLAESVRRELGFSAEPTREELVGSWRAFVWRHHPDRQPPGARDEANARVALGNALYDHARRALRRR
jgi:hypothetical protein